MTCHEHIEKTAASWVNRASAPGFDAADQAELDAWLSASVAHRVAWLRLKSVWDRADRLAVVRARSPLPVRRPRPGLRWLAAAAVLVIAAGAGLWWPQDAARYSTRVGARQAVALPDGSRLELNTRTSMRARVDARARRVWLDGGEAFFDIRPDPRHPFIVEAGSHRVVVLGTKFSVRRHAQGLDVAVLEGRVRVEPREPNAREPAVEVPGGAMLFSKPGGNVVAIDTPARVERALSWRKGILVFDQTTLGDAASQFNRYNERQLVLTDADTAQIRIGGSFDATGVDAFARLLHSGFNLRVQVVDNEIHVSQPD